MGDFAAVEITNQVNKAPAFGRSICVCLEVGRVCGLERLVVVCLNRYQGRSREGKTARSVAGEIGRHPDGLDNILEYALLYPTTG